MADCGIDFSAENGAGLVNETGGTMQEVEART
jgi:hypothetical protein